MPVRRRCGIRFPRSPAVFSSPRKRLANGNTVITSYGAAGKGRVKSLEVTPEKQVVWTYRDEKDHKIHTFQILGEDGKPGEGGAMR